MVGQMARSSTEGLMLDDCGLRTATYESAILAA